MIQKVEKIWFDGKLINWDEAQKKIDQLKKIVNVEKIPLTII